MSHHHKRANREALGSSYRRRKNVPANRGVNTTAVGRKHKNRFSDLGNIR